MPGGRTVINSGADELKTALRKMIDDTKGKPTPEVRAQFVDSWVRLVAIDGFNSDAAKLLYDGFNIAYAEPLHIYMVTVKAANQDPCRKLETLPIANNERQLTLKVLMSLLAYELIEPSSEQSVESVTKILLHYAKSSNGKKNTMLRDHIGYLLIETLQQASGINENAHMGCETAERLLIVLEDPITNYIKTWKRESDRGLTADALLKWIKEQAGNSSPANQVKPTKGVATVPVESSTKQLTMQQKTKVRAFESEPVQEPVSASGKAAPSQQAKDSDPTPSTGQRSKKASASRSSRKIDMTTVLSYLTAYEEDYKKLEERLERAYEEKRRMTLRISELSEQLRNTQREVDDLKSQRMLLGDNYAALQRDADAISSENRALQDKLSQAEDMLTMIGERERHQEDSAIRSLAHELRHDYKDFCEALEMPMDADLGEYMRDQLRTVFDILKDHGVEL